MRKIGIDGVIEVTALTPEIERIDAADASKGRLVVFGGGNYFAPLVENGLDVKLIINASLMEKEKMKHPDQIS